MKNSISNHSPGAALAIAALLSLLLGASSQARAQQAASTNKIIPLIVLEEVPLDDAIRNIARMAGINYILDPRVIYGSKPKLSGRWENITAKQMLGKVLQEHNLKMVENPATSVASSNQLVTPVPGSQVGTETNKVTPVIVLDDILLDEAIKRLAALAHLKVSLDPRLSRGSSGAARIFPTVSFRWENLTPRQALAALLDNYDLIIMVEDPTTSALWITVKKQPPDKSSSPGN